MSVKLTKQIRDHIQVALIKHRFQKEIEIFQNKSAKLADKIYNDVHNKKEQLLMTTVPSSWLRKSANIQVQFGRDYVNLNFNGRNSGFPEISKYSSLIDTIYRVVPVSGCQKVYETTDKISEQYLTLQNFAKDLEDEIKKVGKEISATLNSLSTLSALIKAWPEVEPFVPAYAIKPTSINLPALPVEDLNSQLGLKPAKKEVV